MTTQRQKRAIKFCETILDIEFTGDINNYQHVNWFLSSFLEDAKNQYNELLAEYQSYLWDKL